MNSIGAAASLSPRVAAWGTSISSLQTLQDGTYPGSLRAGRSSQRAAGILPADSDFQPVGTMPVAHSRSRPSAPERGRLVRTARLSGRTAKLAGSTAGPSSVFPKNSSAPPDDAAAPRNDRETPPDFLDAHPSDLTCVRTPWRHLRPIHGCSVAPLFPAPSAPTTP